MGHRTGRRLALSAAFLLAAAGLAGTATGTAQASAAPGAAALDWAEAHADGHGYAWGGTGPDYDCSGLVMEAVLHADGIRLPHNTAAMVDSGLLHPTDDPQRGTLVMFGSPADPYHVEFVTIWPDTSFGAHGYGQPDGWLSWGPGWGSQEVSFWDVG
jgi:hypothetical protein